MTNREKFLEYIKEHGKNDSWENLANEFGFCSSGAIKKFYLRNKNKITNKNIEISKDSSIISFKSPVEITNLDELIKLGKIDTERWEIKKYVQNFWGNVEDPHWQVKAWLAPKSEAKTFQENFQLFLNNYTSPHKYITKAKHTNYSTKSCLVFNKQDAHLNKYSIDGENDIFDRFEQIKSRINCILSKANITSSLDRIVYVIGSDEFNSEFTQCTTKGTPQQNILPYQVAFQAICQHEVQIINLLLEASSKIEILYVPGNHDEYVGWHMVSWLKAYYGSQSNLNIDITYQYRKYYQYSNTALMFNHGDAIKPIKLANIFPIEFKNQWSQCDHFYIFTGDKHHEVSIDFNGIKFFQLPALSNSKSLWDDKNGFTCNKAELKAFLIQENNGLTDTYTELL